MTRRLCMAAAVLIAALVAGCGSDAPDSGATTGPWSYTSGNGQVVKLDRRPERIIAHAYSAAALMEFGIRPIVGCTPGPTTPRSWPS